MFDQVTIPTWYDASDDAWHCTWQYYPCADESIAEEDDFVSAFWQEFSWYEKSFAMAKKESRK
jgi:hypothetical protein